MSKLLLRLLALLSLYAPLAAFAQTFPSKTVHIIVPNSPGGAMDILANLYAQHLRPVWNQPVVIEYKPGANNTNGS